MTRGSALHKRWLKNPKYRKSYDALQDEFALARAVIEARKAAGLTQLELAQKMGTTQPVVARLEAGDCAPASQERKCEGAGDRQPDLRGFVPLCIEGEENRIENLFQVRPTHAVPDTQ